MRCAGYSDLLQFILDFWPILMVLGSLLGGIVGRYINKKIEARTVERLFAGLMGIIILICTYNILQFR